MTAFARALSAETLKMKRTLAVWLALLAPVAIVLLVLVMFVQRADYMISPEHPAWESFVQESIVIWMLLMLPLFVTLEMALLGQLEHGPKMWKGLYALPIPRWAIYAAKQCTGLAVIALSMFVLGAAIVLTGWGLRLAMPGKGFEAPVPWGQIGEAVGLGFLGAWLIIAIHTFISLRSSSFVVACSTGIAATVAGVLVINSDWGPYYPWALPALLSLGGERPEDWLARLLFAIVGGILVAVIGGWDVTRRDTA